mmetsp:Transcript_76013/g.220807  ORF Transcript_76013/g.220807 Transcript_76013/m.220807 type:complete len:292 (-) Transcript_76013:1324-2199(-)
MRAAMSSRFMPQTFSFSSGDNSRRASSSLSPSTRSSAPCSVVSSFASASTVSSMPLTTLYSSSCLERHCAFAYATSASSRALSTSMGGGPKVTAEAAARAFSQTCNAKATSSSRCASKAIRHIRSTMRFALASPSSRSLLGRWSRMGCGTKAMISSARAPPARTVAGAWCGKGRNGLSEANVRGGGVKVSCNASSFSTETISKALSNLPKPCTRRLNASLPEDAPCFFTWSSNNITWSAGSDGSSYTLSFQSMRCNCRPTASSKLRMNGPGSASGSICFCTVSGRSCCAIV